MSRMDDADWPTPAELLQEKERVQTEQAEARRSLAMAEIEKHDRMQKRVEWGVIGAVVLVIVLAIWRFS